MSAVGGFTLINPSLLNNVTKFVLSFLWLIARALFSFAGDW
jgi:hypothetical protein